MPSSAVLRVQQSPRKTPPRIQNSKPTSQLNIYSFEFWMWYAGDHQSKSVIALFVGLYVLLKIQSTLIILII